MPASIGRISALLLLAFVLLAGALGYTAATGPSLTARVDNPRHILAERRILRGRISDRFGETIVETIGTPGSYARRVRYPDAAPVAGYYSINYGRSGIEQAFDATLRGQLDLDPAQAHLNALLHRSPAGRGVQLTLDLSVQRMADALLRGQSGAVVVLSVAGGEVIAMSSQPTFDPNTLDENWDTLRADPAAPLLNRATQGQYQPGTAFQPVLLSEVLRREAGSLDETPEFPTTPFRIDSRALACREEAGVVTLADAFRAACPGPFADLGAVLGGAALQELVATWGLTETSVVELGAARSLTQPLALTDTQSLRELAAGQGSLTVTPLHMALVASTLAARGEMRPARIVSATQAIDGAWQPAPRPEARRVLPASVADQVVAAMPRDGDSVWHAGEGLSGALRLLWFIGMAPVDRPRYAVAVLVEVAADAPQPERFAIEIGQTLLKSLP